MASAFPSLRHSLSSTLTTHSFVETILLASCPWTTLSWSCLEATLTFCISSTQSPVPGTITFVSALWLTRCTGHSLSFSSQFRCCLPREAVSDQTQQSNHSLPRHCVMLPYLLLSSTLSLFVHLVDLGICFLVYTGASYPEALPIAISLGLRDG